LVEAKESRRVRILDKSNPVKVTPVKEVHHTKFSDRVGIKGHKNYSVNMMSGKITYIKGSVKISTGCNTIMAAKAFVAQYLEEMKTGKSSKEIKRKQSGIANDLLENHWKDLMITKKAECKHATGQTYDTNWNVLKEFWGEKTALDVTPNELDKFKVWYLREHPTRFVRKSVNHLKMLFKYMEKNGYLLKVPDMESMKALHEAVEMNAKRVKVGRALKAKEQTSLIEALNLYTKKKPRVEAIRIQLFLRLGLFGGMRVMEILSSPSSKADLEAEVLHAWSAKNGKWREVPMADGMKELFTELKSLDKSQWLFPMKTDPSKHDYTQNFDKHWVAIKKLSNIQGRLRFHDLRHTFATNTAEQGWPPITACDILDMSYSVYQKVYCKPSSASKKSWMKKIKTT
jgi:integrase